MYKMIEENVNNFLTFHLILFLHLNYLCKYFCILKLVVFIDPGQISYLKSARNLLDSHKCLKCAK